MPGDTISYRIAQCEDAAVIHGLLRALASTLGAPGVMKASVDSIRAHGFSDAPAFEAMLAFINAQAVGLIIYFNEFSTWRGTPGLYVQDLYVAAHVRGRGVGRELLARVGVIAEQRGATYIRLCADADDDQAAAFYTKLGFRDAPTDRIFQLDRLPAL